MYYTYACIHIHTHTHTRTHTHIYTHVHTRVHTHTHTHNIICLCVRACLHVCVTIFYQIIVSFSPVTSNSCSMPILSTAFILDSRNHFFAVETTFANNALTVTCNFTSHAAREDVKHSCTVMYGLRRGRNTCTLSSQSLENKLTVSVNQSLISVDLPAFKIATAIDDVTTLCFVVSASDNVHTAEAKGTITVTAGT